ncbi:MAG: hypothetical protein LAT68_11280 [Cyclobacteriaceae bacterium]|nr:hypothetical protein [Cyclobacteriaceae bacterium]
MINSSIADNVENFIKKNVSDEDVSLKMSDLIDKEDLKLELNELIGSIGGFEDFDNLKLELSADDEAIYCEFWHNGNMYSCYLCNCRKFAGQVQMLDKNKK